MHDNIFANLNDNQYAAVEQLEGPLLVLAGAGTGKTRVITSRIVNILYQKLARTSEILAVTFTNKAAKEMKHRVEGMLGYPVHGFWIGTFHSIGLRILRRYYNEVGLKPNFTILDTDDCEKIIKQILLDKNVDVKKYTPSSVANTISRLKDKNIYPHNVPTLDNKTFGNTTLFVVYETYQARLRELNCVDFGDLILLCVDLFRQFPEVLEYWQNYFKYILVDEYQDTNASQYLFIRLLALGHNNICCVGDDDQSIYSWRGAEINNILRFEQDFATAKVIRLEQNYRSTTMILNTAASIIAKNEDRLGKQLWADQNIGDKVKLYEAVNSKMEAEFLATTIGELVKQGVSYNNIAILIRTSYQSREIEERLMFNTIPYRFIGGSRFYDRLEIKDMIAYLRLLYQKSDDMAFLRIINTPTRGIGATSIEKIRQHAIHNKLSMFVASQDMLSKAMLSNKLMTSLEGFLNLFLDNTIGDNLGELAKDIAQRSGYMDYWVNENTQEAKSRVENIKELFGAIGAFNTLEDFLEHVSLVSDNDEDAVDNKVNVLTIHGAKGLEFEVVFLPGWEEGIFPSPRSLEENGLSEERRLAYVAVTRAKKSLYVSFSRNRYMYGNLQVAIGSRFLDEMDSQSVEKLNGRTHHYEKAMQDEIINKALYQEFIPSKSLFNVGMRVCHSTMGQGVITALQGPVATVEFSNNDGENSCSKKVMVSFLKVSE